MSDYNYVPVDSIIGQIRLRKEDAIDAGRFDEAGLWRDAERAVHEAKEAAPVTMDQTTWNHDDHFLAEAIDVGGQPVVMFGPWDTDTILGSQVGDTRIFAYRPGGLTLTGRRYELNIANVVKADIVDDTVADLQATLGRVRAALDSIKNDREGTLEVLMTTCPGEYRRGRVDALASAIRLLEEALHADQPEPKDPLPEIPKSLSTFDDFFHAPEGTVVSEDHGIPYISNTYAWHSITGRRGHQAMGGKEHAVLRWGYGS